MAEINDLAAVAAYSSFVDALRAVFGGETEVTEQKRVYGGDINDAYELHLSGGQRIFMKTNQINNYRFFETEARDWKPCVLPGPSVCRSCWASVQTGSGDSHFCCWNIWRARLR